MIEFTDDQKKAIAAAQEKFTDLKDKVERDMEDLESRMTKKMQRALDNPLAN